MIGWLRGSALAYAVVGPPRLPTIEEWADMHKDKATPDQIIAAAVIQRIASHFPKWEIKDDSYNLNDDGHPKTYVNQNEPSLHGRETILFSYPGNPGKAVTVRFHVFYKRGGISKKYENFNTYHWRVTPDSIFVNDVALDPIHAEAVFNAYFEVKAKNDALEKAKQIAEETMKLNHAKWELVENTFGMVRNGMGHVVEKKDAKTKRKSVPRKAAAKAGRTKPSKFKAGGYTGTKGSVGRGETSLTPLDTLDDAPFRGIHNDTTLGDPVFYSGVVK